MDVPAFAAAQLALLAEEQDAEVEETRLLTSTHAPSVLARAGLAMVNLQLHSQRTGLGGKTVVEIGLDPGLGGAGKELPQHALRVGDIVGLAEQPRGSEKKKDRVELERAGASGVVVRVMRELIVVALDREEVEVPNGRLWLVKLANDVTFKRMNFTMTRLQKMTEAEHPILTRVLLGHTAPTPVSEAELRVPVKCQNDSLNNSQREAVRFALASREVALIHGPPGTGKTQTLVELIVQLVRQKKRVLVCGPSNISVDNMVERLVPHEVSMLRLGHPARLLPGVLGHSLDHLTKTSDAAALVNDIRQELDDKQASIRKTRNGRERRLIYGEMKDLRKEYRERESRCVHQLLRASDVILSTLHGAGGHQLRSQNFDIVVIDEASQALEASSWIPLLGYGATKVVLAGDHLQLPPTIKSTNGNKSEVQDGVGGARLDETMFDRLLEMHGTTIKCMLTTQYRMHEKIMRFPSDSLYESKLMAAEGVKARLLTELPYEVSRSEETQEPLVFYDTQGGDFPEQLEEHESGSSKSGSSKSGLLGDSKCNPSEALVVRSHLNKLIRVGVRVDDIAVITPYNGQVAVLSQMLKSSHPGLEIGSVDGFQGREKEAVIVSLVRSNGKGEVGFLSEKRRLNVAMTRPRRQLCVVGDSETVGRGGKFLQAWMQHLEENADLRYPDMATVSQD